jgi:pyruvate/2-oxoacid:ferredoxin oxidoreductase beta subunit/intein/homing endonuclease
MGVKMAKGNISKSGRGASKPSGAISSPKARCSSCSFFLQGATNCSGCPETIAVRTILGVAGANTVVVNATSCLEIVSSQYPYTSWGVNYIHGAFENAAAIAGGVSLALEKMGKVGNVIAIAGDGGTLDIGLQALSGMLERGEKVCYVCLDNEAYMNCLARDAWVMTKSGLRRITEIRKGDKLYSFDPKTQKLVLRNCAGVYDNGIKEVFEVRTLHHLLKATGNHPFLVVKHKGRGKESELVWKTVEELKKGDEVVVLKGSEKGKSFKFPVIKRITKGDYKVNKLNDVTIPESSSHQIMKYLGIYVGDGWVRSGRAEIGFSLPDGKEERKTLIELHKQVFGSKYTEDKNEVHVNSINLANFINSLGFGSGAKNKLIPEWVFTLPFNEKEAFVEGLMISDGYKVKNSGSMRYVSASSRLLETLRLLLQTTGYRVGKIHKIYTPKGSKVVKRALLKDSECGYICFSKTRKWNVERYPSQYKYANFLIANEHFSADRIMGIKNVGREPTLDLQVEESHNFIANGYVVHNTGVQRSGATPLGASTTTSPSGSVIPGNMTWKKPIVEIVAAHHIPYVATASVGYLEDLKAKVAKALRKENQPSFLHVLNPCPLGWKFDSWRTVEMGRLAVETGMWILSENENGKMRITRNVAQRKPVEEYLRPQGRFAHLFKPGSEHIVKQIQERVDNEWERTNKMCSE